MGEPLTVEFLHDIPGVNQMNQNTVKQQLSNLKASGDYDLIVLASPAYRRAGLRRVPD